MAEKEEEKTALVDVAEEVKTDEGEDFSPTDFLDLESIEVVVDDKEKIDVVEDTTEEKVEEPAIEEPIAEEEVKEEVKEEAKEEEDKGSDTDIDDDYTDWETLEDDKEEAEAVSEKEDKETKSLEWESLSNEIGIEAESYEDFVSKIKTSLSVKKDNEKVSFLEKMKTLTDEELMRKELKARDYDSDEVDEEIEDLIDDGNLKREAKRVRKSLDKAIANERSNIEKSESEAVSKQTEELEQARTGLKEYLSKTEDFFGGRVNNTQKEQHFKYITSGKFLNEIMGNHESLAKSAWLWRYRDKMLKDTAKASRTKGFEEGKKQILDNIQNPESVKVTRVPEPETGEFNANKFLDSESM